MTTIAMRVRDGRVWWASDLAVSRGAHMFESDPKCWASDGVAWGTAGRSVMVPWCRSNPPPATPDGLPEWAAEFRAAAEELGVWEDGAWEGDVLVGYAGSDAALYLVCGDCTVLRVRGDFYAIGSGSEYALGAMACYAMPDDAVHIAARWDCKTSGLVEGMVP